MSKGNLVKTRAPGSARTTLTFVHMPGPSTGQLPREALPSVSCPSSALGLEQKSCHWGPRLHPTDRGSLFLAGVLLIEGMGTESNRNKGVKNG